MVLVVDMELQIQFEKAEAFLMEKEMEYKQAELTAKQLREQLCKKMEEQGIKSWETDNLRVTYVAPVDRLSVDSKKLKEKYPQVYSECQKMSKIKSSVRIAIKGQADEITGGNGNGE